ncbi:MAG TPA: SRPBCC family protein [Microlunatus sp.]|nr:SRPBCC family protein [Microlunatus sp.]
MGTPGANRRVAATPKQVFDVLADGWLYPVWVVGASRMREVEEAWPATDSRLHHSFGVWPLLINDKTTVIEWEPERRAVFEAEGWPLGSARVVLTAEPDGPTGCLLTLVEDAHRGPGLLMPKPLRQGMILRRNTETLRRLAYVAEGRAIGSPRE